MGRSRAEKAMIQSHTLPSSPTHSFSSSSSSEFEFRNSSFPLNKTSCTALCPADDLFYKGQLLPLHLSPRLSMVRTLLLASSSASSSSDTTTSASRDSSGSSSSSDAVLFAEYNCDSSRPSSVAEYNCDSSRPSSVAELEDEFLKRPLNAEASRPSGHGSVKKSRYFSLAKISSVFKKEPRTSAEPISSEAGAGSSSVKRMSASARDVFRKYLKKVKPLYEKLSQKQKICGPATSSLIPNQPKSDGSGKSSKLKDSGVIGHSFSGSKGLASSCPSSMRSSPCHSGVLTRIGFPNPTRSCSTKGCFVSSKDSSMEDLQNAIQGAIAHCKNSMSATG